MNDPFPPACGIYSLLGGMLPSSATEVKAVVIFLAVILIGTSPFTAALNTLVIMAVKTKSQLRAHKSNILLACLATTDLMVGVIVQPMFAALTISIVVGEKTTESCALQNLTQVFGSLLIGSSLLHLGLISGERYLAMKRAYAYDAGLVTEARLLIGSALAWSFSFILKIPFFVDKAVFLIVSDTFVGLSLVIITFCQIMVYREVCRHENEISTQQVTEEARQNFLKNKKAFKLTAIIVSVPFVCYIPVCVFRIVVIKYRSNIPIETLYLCFFSTACLAMLNSLLNPLIYSVRMRQFRVAFIEIICRTANITEAEEIEMRVFGTANALGVAFEAGQGDEGDQHNTENTEQPDVNNKNNEVLPQHENHIEQVKNCINNRNTRTASP